MYFSTPSHPRRTAPEPLQSAGGGGGSTELKGDEGFEVVLSGAAGIWGGLAVRVFSGTEEIYGTKRFGGPEGNK